MTPIFASGNVGFLQRLLLQLQLLLLLLLQPPLLQLHRRCLHGRTTLTKCSHVSVDFELDDLDVFCKVWRRPPLLQWPLDRLVC